MKLTVLGCWGPYAPQGEACSSYLLSGEKDSLLLDMGNGSLSRLWSYTDPCHLTGIVLTHLHHDHISDLHILKYYLQRAKSEQRLEKKLLLFLPAEPKEMAALAAREEDLFHVGYTYDSLEEKAGEFDLSFHAMRHPVPCMGVRIQNGGKTLAYTGDTNLHPGLSSFAAGADLLLIDGALPKEKWSENAPHLTVEQAASFASLAGQTVVTHHDPSFAGEEAKKAAAGCLWAAEKEEYLL